MADPEDTTPLAEKISAMSRRVQAKREVKRSRAVRAAYSHSAKLKRYAAGFRKNPTKAEMAMSAILDGIGERYIFQEPFLVTGNAYIADFYLPLPVAAVLEVDGSYHEKPGQRTKDQKRDEHFRKRDVAVLRFDNSEVLENPEQVAMTLRHVCQLRRERKRRP